MKHIKFIHLSDLHIGFETHGKINPETGKNTRLEDTLRSLDFIADVAVRESVDLVLVAGDVFHRGNPHPTEETEFAKRVARLTNDAGAEVVIALGNHDYTGGFGRAAAVEIFPALGFAGVRIAKKPALLNIETKSGRIQVACLPWAGKSVLLAKDEYKSLSPEELQRTVERMLIETIRDLADGVDKNHPALFLAHLAVREAEASGTETSALLMTDPSIPASELRDSAFAYVALGHIHKFQNLNRLSAPPVIYSGSIERIDFSEEREEKGFILGNISRGEGGWECDFEFIETPARRFITMDVEGSGDEIAEAVAAEATRKDVRDAVVRVRCKVSGSESEAIDERRIREILKEADSVKIERILSRSDKPRRQSEISKSWDVMDALEEYIKLKPELKGIAGEMKARASELLRETESG